MKPQFVRYFVKDPILDEDFMYCGLSKSGFLYNVYRYSFGNRYPRFCDKLRKMRKTDFTEADDDKNYKWREVTIAELVLIEGMVVH